MESLTGEDDGWMDDDFGLSVKAHKPPPPYPMEEGQQEPGRSSSLVHFHFHFHSMLHIGITISEF